MECASNKDWLYNFYILKCSSILIIFLIFYFEDILKSWFKILISSSNIQLQTDPRVRSSMNLGLKAEYSQ